MSIMDLASFHAKLEANDLQLHDDEPQYLRVRLRNKRCYNRYPSPAINSRDVGLISEAALHFCAESGTWTLAFTTIASQNSRSLTEADRLLQEYILDTEYIVELFPDMVLARRSSTNERDTKFYGTRNLVL